MCISDLIATITLGLPEVAESERAPEGEGLDGGEPKGEDTEGPKAGAGDA